MSDRIIHSGDAPMGFKDLVADESEYGPKVWISGGSINTGTFTGQTQYYNETTWDNARNNTNVAIITSGSYTGSQNSTTQVNYNALGAYVMLDVCSVPGLGKTIQMFIDILEPDGTFTAIYQTAALSTIGLRKYLIYPGAVDDGSQLTGITRLPLPRTWRVRINLSDESSMFNYAISAYYVGI